MKKVLFSLLMVAAMLPFVAKAQSNSQYAAIITHDTAVCGQLTWMDGVTYTEDATATFVVNDTMHFLNLTVWPTYNQTISVSADCGYRVDATHAYYTTGSHVYTGQTRVHHCDSIVNINLTILNQNYSADSTVTGCVYYTWRGTRYNNSASFVDTIHHAGQACDSIISLTINVLAPDTVDAFDTISACTSYRYRPNQGSARTFTSTGDIDDVFPSRSIAKCQDSIKHVHVIINYPDTVNVRMEDCGSIVYDSVEYTSSVYNRVIKVGRTVENCDSNINLTLIVNPTPQVVIEGEWQLSEGGSTTLYASCDQENVAYVWNYDGKTSNADSIVLTNVQKNTDVQLQARNTQTNCMASTWITVTTYLDIQGAQNANINLYPNPTVNVLNVESNDAVSMIEIFNEIGQQVVSSRNTTLDLSHLTKGTYTVRVVLENGTIVTKKVIVTK